MAAYIGSVLGDVCMSHYSRTVRQCVDDRLVCRVGVSSHRA
jgi:hypothetical protein